MIEVTASVEGVEGAVALDTDPLVARLVWAAGRLGLEHATLGLMVVSAERMRALNAEHRALDAPTDVLSFPVDGPELGRGDWATEGPPPELGDIVICPAVAEDPLATLCVHGLLHLLGHDHESDQGEMLLLQDRLVAEAGLIPPPTPPTAV